MHYRPNDWSDYIGQAAAVYQLRVRAKAARLRGVPMGHTLIYSKIAGAGKTALAELTAQEIGTEVTSVTEPVKPNRARLLFIGMQEGDILFFDEFHKQFENGKKGAEWLLTYLIDGLVPGPTGRNQPAPKVTVIGATTDVGVMGEPFLRRFPNQVPLEPYSDDEAQQIVATLSMRILDDEVGLPTPTPEVCAAIARAASNTPGDAVRILETVRDLVVAGELNEGISDGSYALTGALAMAGYTPDGLSVREQKCLIALHEDFRCEPTGERLLASRLGEEGGGLLRIANKLTDKGLVLSTKQGRVLTDEGVRRTQELLAA